MPTKNVIDGLFTETPDGPRLTGSRCATCGAPYFPSSPVCHNPNCTESRIENALSSLQGAGPQESASLVDELGFACGRSFRLDRIRHGILHLIELESTPDLPTRVPIVRVGGDQRGFLRSPGRM